MKKLHSEELEFEKLKMRLNKVKMAKTKNKGMVKTFNRVIQKENKLLKMASMKRRMQSKNSHKMREQYKIRRAAKK